MLCRTVQRHFKSKEVWRIPHDACTRIDHAIQGLSAHQLHRCHVQRLRGKQVDLSSIACFKCYRNVKRSDYYGVAGTAALSPYQLPQGRRRVRRAEDHEHVRRWRGGGAVAVIVSVNLT